MAPLVFDPLYAYNDDTPTPSSEESNLYDDDASPCNAEPMLRQESYSICILCLHVLECWSGPKQRRCYISKQVYSSIFGQPLQRRFCAKNIIRFVFLLFAGPGVMERGQNAVLQ